MHPSGRLNACDRRRGSNSSTIQVRRSRILNERKEEATPFGREQFIVEKEMNGEITKPHLKRYYDAVKAFDMIPIQHTCGYATTSSRTSSTWGLSAGRRCSRPTTSWPCRNSSATSAIARLDVIVYVATIDLGCWDDCAHMAFRSICRD